MGASKYLNLLQGQISPKDLLTTEAYMVQLTLELLANGSSPEFSRLLGLARADGDQEAIAFFQGLLSVATGIVIPILTDAQRAAVTSVVGGLLANGSDGVLYSLQGDPVSATFDDTTILYTVVLPGQAGNQYVLNYVGGLGVGAPVQIWLDDSQTAQGNFTLNIKKRSSTQASDIVAAFVATPSVSQFISAAVQGDGGVPDFGSGNFSNGGPVWTPANEGIFEPKIDGDFDLQGHNVVNVASLTCKAVAAQGTSPDAFYSGDGQGGLVETYGNGPNGTGGIRATSHVEVADSTPINLFSFPLNSAAFGSFSEARGLMELTVNAFSTAGQKGGSWKIMVAFNLHSGAATITDQTVLYSQKDDADLAVTVSIPSADTMQVQITGTDSNAYHWNGTLEITGVITG